MLSTTLPDVDSGQHRKLALANKVRVTTTYSQDGRGQEVFYTPYNPQDGFALFLFEDVLNASANVADYSVYDAEGQRVTTFNQERFPKRV